jgi:predicted aspartyl protease
MAVSQALATAAILLGSPIAALPPQPVPVSPSPLIDQLTTTEQLAIRTDDGDRLTVPVSVAGSGPYRFLVDTGSQRTVISRELASHLRLASGRNTILHSVMGSNDVRTVHIPQLKVSSRVISVTDAPALRASHIGADGMLGIDSLRSQRVMFDFKGRLIFTHARIAGKKVTVIVDTGSQVTIANTALQAMLARRGYHLPPERVMIQSVTGEQMFATLTPLPELELGGVMLQDLSVAFADAHIFRQLKLDKRPAILLGMNAMKAFDRISIDFKSKKVRFVLPGTSMLPTVRLASAGGH